MAYQMTEAHKRKIGLANSKKRRTKEQNERNRLAHLGKKLYPNGRSTPWLIGEKNPKWKGNSVGKVGLHYWVRRKLGKPTECVYCGAVEKLEWASISHHAKRDENDYIPLCIKCHRKYDKPYKIMTENWKKTLFKKGIVPWNKGKTYSLKRITD